MKQQSSWMYLMILFVGGSMGMGCVKRDAVSIKKTPLKAPSCVKGKLVNEEKDSPMAYVPVLTEPRTVPQVTDKMGFFEICYQRKQNKSTRETLRLPIARGQYALVVRKENFKTRRIKFAYQGKTLSLGVIRMRNKNVHLPNQVKQTKDTNTNRKDTGIIGKIPKTE